jgi:hypothetical protein
VIKDPAIQAIVDGGTAPFLSRSQKFERVLLWVLVVAVAGLGFGYLLVNGIAHQARDASNKAGASVQASCQFWHDLSQVPLSDTSTRVVFTIIADARIAYAGLGCSPALPPADPRVAALLPHGVH